MHWHQQLFAILTVTVQVKSNSLHCYLSRGEVVLHTYDVEEVVADGGGEAARPGPIAQQRGGVRAVWHHVMPKCEHLHEAQAQEAELAAPHHVHQRPHHQQQRTHLTMLAFMNGLQPFGPHNHLSGRSIATANKIAWVHR